MTKLPDQTDEQLAQSMVKYAHLGVSAPTKACMETFPEMTDKQVACAFMKGKLKSGQFRRRVGELLDKQGLNLFKANTKLSKLLEHKRGVLVRDKIEYVDDGQIQSKNLELLYKLHGVLQGESKDTTHLSGRADSLSFSLSLNPSRLDDLKQIISDLKELNESLKQSRYHREGEVIEIRGEAQT